MSRRVRQADIGHWGFRYCYSCPLPPSLLSSPLRHPLWVVKELRGRTSSDEQLDPLADGLPADRAGLERGAAVDAGGVSALEDQLDVVVDADGAGDSLFHLPIAGLKLLQQVVLLRVLGAGAAIHFCLVCGGGGSAIIMNDVRATEN